MEEASQGVEMWAKDNRDREVDSNPEEVSEEKAVEEGLTKAPQKGTLESTPKQRMLTRTAAGIAVSLLVYWIKDCPPEEEG